MFYFPQYSNTLRHLLSTASNYSIGWPTFRIVYLYTLQYTVIDKTGLCLTVRFGQVNMPQDLLSVVMLRLELIYSEY